MSDDILDKIAENAEAPKQVSGDSGSVQQHDLSDQIEADRYVRARDAQAQRARGFRVSKIVPPGTV